MVRRVSILALALCLMLNVNALAVTPRTETTSRCIPNLSITGNTARCSLRVASPDAKASITATVTLLKSDGEGGFTVLYRWAGERNRRFEFCGYLYQQQNHRQRNLSHGVFCACGRKLWN